MSTIMRSNVRATLGEFGDFEGFDGAEFDIQTVDHYPAGAQSPEKLTSTGTYTDVTLTRAYDPSRDAAVEDWFAAFQAGRENPRTVSVSYLNQLGVPERTRTIGPCKPKNVMPPGGKSGDGTPAEFKVVLSVEGVL